VSHGKWETAAPIRTFVPYDNGRSVLANVSTNQDAFHAKFGGIVPEIASRKHVELLAAAIEDALGRAGVSLDDVDGIAVTAGPGLVGSLAVGVAHAKALAFAARTFRVG